VLYDRGYAAGMEMQRKLTRLQLGLGTDEDKVEQA
jgi:hypothetical protein